MALILGALGCEGSGPGGGGGPAIQVTPTTLDFGAYPVGVEVALAVTLTNIGTADLTVSRIAVEEDDAVSEFIADP